MLTHQFAEQRLRLLFPTCLVPPGRRLVPWRATTMQQTTALAISFAACSSPSMRPRAALPAMGEGRRSRYGSSSLGRLPDALRGRAPRAAAAAAPCRRGRSPAEGTQSGMGGHEQVSRPSHSAQSGSTGPPAASRQRRCKCALRLRALCLHGRTESTSEIPPVMMAVNWAPSSFFDLIFSPVGVSTGGCEGRTFVKSSGQNMISDRRGAQQDSGGSSVFLSAQLQGTCRIVSAQQVRLNAPSSHPPRQRPWSENGGDRRSPDWVRM